MKGIFGNGAGPLSNSDITTLLVAGISLIGTISVALINNDAKKSNQILNHKKKGK